jgi:hypothetical protein
MAPADYLRLGVEAYLASLTDDEFARLLCVVRPQAVQASEETCVV